MVEVLLAHETMIKISELDYNFSILVDEDDENSRKRKMVYNKKRDLLLNLAEQNPLLNDNTDAFYPKSYHDN